jgi:hypothetical protein
MEDIVGVRVVDRERGEFGFITWGRVFGPVEEAKLAAAVRISAERCGLGAIESVTVCESLQALSGHPYFFEALLEFAREAKPRGAGYVKWLAGKRKAVEQGREIYFLGDPRPRRDGAGR